MKYGLTESGIKIMDMFAIGVIVLTVAAVFLLMVIGYELFDAWTKR